MRAPSFIHYIEKGLKVPNQEIARQLAQVLGDDELLYSAWARMGGVRDFKQALFDREVLHRTIFGPQLPRRFVMSPPYGSPETSSEHEGMEELGSIGTCRRAAADPGPPSPSFLLKVPVLPESSDPDQEPEPLEMLRFDPGLLSRDADLLRPFAYRLSAEGARRAPERLRAGDLVLITRSAWPLLPEQVYALRIAGRVALSPAAWEEGALWALGGKRSQPSRAREALGTGAPPAALVGRVALVVRSSAGV